MKTLAIPNGSLYEKTINLLKKIGIEIHVKGRSYEVQVKGSDIFTRAYIMRPQKIPRAVFRGVANAGICGFDCVCEEYVENAPLQIISELNFGRNSEKSVKIIIFSKRKKIVDKENMIVSAEYTNLAKKFFKKARIEYSCGTTEADIITGLADYGVGVTESGKSIADNGLKILKEIMISPVVLIAKERSPKLEFFGKQINGALESEKFQLIKMDAERAAVEEIIKNIPSIQSPTVNVLANGSFAIETVAPKKGLSDLILKLQKVGAKGIIVQDINILM